MTDLIRYIIYVSCLFLSFTVHVIQFSQTYHTEQELRCISNTLLALSITCTFKGKIQLTNIVFNITIYIAIFLSVYTCIAL